VKTWWKSYWLLMLAIVAGITGIVDIAAYLDGGPDATLSSTLFELVSQWPILAVLIGIIVGHLFWPQKKKD